MTMGAPNDCGGRRKFPTMSQIPPSIQSICFHKTSDSNMAAPNLVLASGAIFPRYAPGRSKFGGAKGPHKASLVPLCSNLRYFESKCTVLKKVFVTLLGLYGAPCSHSVPPAVIWRPHSDSAAGELGPCCVPAIKPLVSCRSTPESRTALQGRNDGEKEA